MANATIRLVEDNSAPPIVLTLERDASPADVPINVTGCTVSLIISDKGTITNAGHQTCVLTNAVAGIVTYTPQAVDFPHKGTYKCDIKIVYPDSSVEIMYDQLKVKARAKLT